MRKRLVLIVLLHSVIYTICFAEETLSLNQNKSREWLKKAEETDTPSIKIEYYTKAIELDANYLLYYYRGSAFADIENLDEALKDYNKAIELNKEDAYIYICRGYIFSIKGQEEDAIKDYTKAIELDPKETSVYFNRGISFGKKGYYGKAIIDLTKFIQLEPGSYEAYYNRGNAYI